MFSCTVSGIGRVSTMENDMLCYFVQFVEFATECMQGARSIFGTCVTMNDEFVQGKDSRNKQPLTWGRAVRFPTHYSYISVS